MYKCVASKTGSKIWIEVKIEGVHKPRVTWFIGESPASSIGDSWLVISNSKLSMAGKVRVLAENSVGADKAAIDLRVKGTLYFWKSSRLLIMQF